jgi:hypothetical protein
MLAYCETMHWSTASGWRFNLLMLYSVSDKMLAARARDVFTASLKPRAPPFSPLGKERNMSIREATFGGQW